MMKYITFASLLNLTYGFKTFNQVVVGSDVSSKLSSIALAKKGYNVCNVIQKKPTVDQNYILTEDDLFILNNYNINYHSSSVDTDSLINHLRDKPPVKIQFDFTTSMSKIDLLNILDEEMDKLGIEKTFDEVKDVDITSKNLHLSASRIKYDTLVTSDSNIVSMFEPKSSLVSYSKVDNKYTWKSFMLSASEVKKMEDYVPSWDSSLHLWRSPNTIVHASPSINGGLFGQVSSESGVCELNEFPELYNCMDPYNALEFDRKLAKSKYSNSLSYFGLHSTIFIGNVANYMGCESLRMALQDSVLFEHCVNNAPDDIAYVYDKVKKKNMEYDFTKFKIPLF